MIGSWAGAMGQSQFMPSSYLAYAIDYNKDKKVDLWNTYEDIFASIANYLNRHGWKKDNYWSLEYFSENKYLEQLSENKKYLNNELIKNSISSNLTSYFYPENFAEIIIVKKNPNKRYFLKFSNFNIIKKYNNSDFYALVVGDLANKLKEN